MNKLEERIEDLDTSIAAKDRNLKGLKKSLQDHKKKLGSMNTDLKKKISGIEGLNAHIQQRDNSITKFKEYIAGLEKKLKDSIEQARAKIIELEKSIEAKDGSITQIKVDLDGMEKKYEASTFRAEGAETRIGELEVSIQEKDGSISNLKDDLAVLEEKNQNETTRAVNAEKAIEELQGAIEQKDGSIVKLEDDNAGLEAKLNDFTVRAEETKKRIAELKGVVKEKDNSLKLLKKDLSSLDKENKGSIARADKAENIIVELEKTIDERGQEVSSREARIRAMQDNFAILDGIGPKVSNVLRSAGITSFARLADTDFDKITDILMKENPSLTRLTDPSTWPAQARLAADGDWEGLKELQESIKEGRRSKALPEDEVLDAVASETIVVSS